MDIKLKGGKNFRDFSGFHTTAGQAVRGNLFIRGGHLSKLTDRDVKVLSRYSPKTILDLRTPVEEAEKPNKPIPGADNVIIPVFTDSKAGLSREKGTTMTDMVRKCKDRDLLYRTVPNLSELYKVAVTDEYSLGQVSQILNLCLDNAIAGKTTVFHCTAGKDRTGILAMLLLHILGVSKEDIMADYMKTNRSARGEANGIFILVFLFKQSYKCAKKLRDVMVAKREYLESVYEEMDRRFGGVDGYLTEGLGISSEKLEQFRASMLTD